MASLRLILCRRTRRPRRDEADWYAAWFNRKPYIFCVYATRCPSIRHFYRQRATFNTSRFQFEYSTYADDVLVSFQCWNEADPLYIPLGVLHVWILRSQDEPETLVWRDVRLNSSVHTSAGMSFVNDRITWRHSVTLVARAHTITLHNYNFRTIAAAIWGINSVIGAVT